MQIRSLDGQRVVEINAISSRLKMACDAENLGNTAVAEDMLDKAVDAEADLTYLECKADTEAHRGVG